MICDGCGVEQPAMKMVVYRDAGDEEWSLCDRCYAEMAESVWIVPGPYAVWGHCNECQGWYSLNDMARWAGGGKHDAPQGACTACAGG